MNGLMSGKRQWVIITAGLLLAVMLLSGCFSLQKRIGRYVDPHLETLEQDMHNYFVLEQPLRYDGEISYVNHWSGTHPMVEYILFTGGGQYCGFYYSPDDVPLAFQNTPCTLRQDGAVWSWSADGENKGTTGRIRAQWFWFEVQF